VVLSASVVNVCRVRLTTETRRIHREPRRKAGPPLPYSKTFKDHLANPRNAGELADANASAEQTNPVCGDRLRLSLRLRDGEIEAARFLAYGCPPTLACGSVLAEMIEGMKVLDAMKLTRKEVAEALGGLPTRKHHAAALAIETLRIAVESNKDPQRD
jgi:NifU-like protein involved in Fe-S cluster formation